MQYSPLTMQWCLDCHRTQKVQVDGNDYYADYHQKMMEKHGSEAEAMMTVESIGGTECARCHY